MSNELVQLESNEFIILKYDHCDIIEGDDKACSFIPCSLYLTNRRLITFPFSNDAKELKAISIFQIESFSLHKVNECQTLFLFYSKNPPIKLFLVENLLGFTKILTKLCKASVIGAQECDKLALKIKKKIEKSNSLSSFFQKEKHEDENDDGRYKRNEGKKINGIEVINDLIDHGEILLFGLIIVVICFLTVLFYYVSFGVCVCSVLFVYVIQHGFRLLFSEDEDAKNENFKMELQIPGFRKFRKSFENRFLWKNPRHTFEVFLFLFSSTLIFTCYSSALILAASLFVFAYIERWNPFGFGSLSDMLSNLFDFS